MIPATGELEKLLKMEKLYKNIYHKQPETLQQMRTILTQLAEQSKER